MELEIEGMTCNHCRMAVDKALRGIKGVTDVKVSLEEKIAEITGSDLNSQSLIDAVTNAGFKAAVKQLI